MSEAYDDLLQWVMDAAADRREDLDKVEKEEQRGEQDALQMAEETRKLAPVDDSILERELESGVSPERLDEILSLRTMELAKDNPEVMRGIQRRAERDEQQRREAAANEQLRIDRENRARASAGLRELVPGGSFLGNIENRVIAAVQDEKSRHEELAGIRNELAAKIQKWEESKEFEALDKNEQKRFAQWGVSLLQSISDAERIRKDRPNDLHLWEESVRAGMRYIAEGESALAGFARMLSGDRVGKELQGGFEALMADPKWAMSARAGQGWKEDGFNWNRFSVVATSGTLSMAECIGGALAGNAGASAVLKSASAAGKVTRGASIAAKTLPMVGWALPMTVKTAGQSFGESMAYWQSRNDVSDREKYWRSVGQALTDAGIEFVSEEASYMLEWGASKVVSRLNKARKPIEQMTVKAVTDSLLKKVGRAGMEGFTSFLEEWGEEDFSSWGQEFSQMAWRGDSELLRAWKNEGKEGIGNWIVTQSFENAVGVLSTLATGAAHGYRQYQWEGAQDWFSRPADVLEDYNIRDRQTGNYTVAGVQSLLEGNEQGLTASLAMLQSLGTEDANTGIELINRMHSQAQRFGRQGLMEDSLDASRGDGAVDVVEFQDDSRDAKRYMVMIGQGTDVSSIAIANTAEEAAFLQEMARSNAIGTVSPYLIQVPNTNAYAVKRENGGWAVYSDAGDFQFDNDNPAAKQFNAGSFLKNYQDVKALPKFQETLPLPAVKNRQAEQTERETQETQTQQPEANTEQQTEQAAAAQEGQTEQQTSTQEGQAEQQAEQAAAAQKGQAGQATEQATEQQPGSEKENMPENRPVQKPVKEAQAEHDAATMEPIENAIEEGKEGLRDGLEAQIAELEEKQNSKGLSDDEKQQLDILKQALADLDNPRSIEELEREEGEEPKGESKPSDTAEPGEEAKPVEESKPAEQPKPSEKTRPTERPKPAEEKPAEQPKPSEESKPAEEKPVEETKPAKPNRIIYAREIADRLIRGDLRSITIVYADGTVEGTVHYDESLDETRPFVWDSGNLSTWANLVSIVSGAIKEGATITENSGDEGTSETTNLTEQPKPVEEKPAEERSAEQPKPAKEKPSEDKSGGEQPSPSGNLLAEQENQEAEKIKNLRSDIVQRFIDLVEDMNSSAAVKRGVLNRLARENDISVKTAEELAEALVVAKVRLIAANRKMNLEQKWEEVKRVYEHQPNFSTRTSTSLINQAYSTPVPISFMGGIRIGAERNNIVYEPTAGTGSLVAVAQSRDADVYANELNPVRVAILERFGGLYESITQGDALATKNDAPVDIVMTNPPFANAKPMKFGDFTLNKLDHQIAAHALNDLKVDGRALVIVGANTRSDGAPTYADHVFMNFLYTNFNVVDNYIIDGSLYRKQGQSNPIRLLTVNGRRKASDGMVESPTEIRTLKTFDEVFEALKEELPHGQSKSAERLSDYVYSEGREGTLPSGNDGRNGGAARDSGGVSEGSEQPLQPGSRGSAGSRGGERTEGSGERDGVRDGGQGGVRGGNESVGNTQPNASDVQGNRDGMVQEPQSEGTEGRRGLGDVSSRPDVPSRSDGRAEGMGGDTRVEQSGIRVGKKVGDKYNAYISASKSNAIGTVVNSNLAEPLSIALSELQEAVGDVDEYVRQELGYESKEELYKGLAAEQIDGVALAVRQLGQNNGFLIGDVTGLGKGRQAAAIIRWAQKHGKLPIFFTEKPSLFSSMYYDGQDIGSDFKPLLMGNPDEGKIFTRDGGKLLFSPPSDNKKLARALNDLANGVGDCDCLFTNYTQFNKADNSEKKQAFKNLLRSQDVVFVLDEAHNAAGESQTGQAIRGMIAGKPVLYSSATAIKRPDNLPVYFRLNIFGGKPIDEQRLDAFKMGGPVLMQLLTRQMVRDGMYVRREKDLSDVKYDMKTVKPKNFDKVKSDADRLSEAFRKIVALSEKVKAVIKKLNKYARGTGSGGIRYNGFASALHNFVSQYLLAAKIDNTVDEAISSMQRGEKVVIALTNTMESVLEDFVDAQGLAKGDIVNLRFADVLRRYVSGVNGDGRGRLFRATQPNPTGRGSITIQYTPDELGLREEYDFLVDELEDILEEVEFPLSPIDMIETKIRNAGYDVGEITKREYVIDYDVEGDKATLNKRVSESTNKTISKFNNGGIDCLIINAAGSTGISLHASEKIKDQRPRRMIIVQPSLDINTVVQTLGRINRTGQVTKPFFTFLATPLTAEVRPNFMLAKKMRSLGASTSGDQRGDVDLGTDFINEYGDIVAAEWLVQNDDLRRVMALDEPSELNGELIGEDDLMAKLTGRTVLFDDATQLAIFDALTDAYNDKVDELKRLGKYTLDMNQFDEWDATVVSSEIIEDGVEVKALEVSDKYDIMSEKNVMALFRKNIGEDPAGMVNGLIASMRNMVEEMPKAYENGEDDADMPSKQREEQTRINKFELMMREMLELQDDGAQKSVAPALLNMSIERDVYPAALVGIKANLTNKRHPGNLGQIRLKFAVAGPVQLITVPASRIVLGKTAPLSLYAIEQNWHALGDKFTGERLSSRRVRFSFEGDLVRAFGISGSRNQTVARYTYRDGTEATGVIQPKGWLPDDMKHDPRLNLNTVDEILEYLDNEGTTPVVFSRDGIMWIRKYPTGNYALMVPAAARSGGKRYAGNEDVLALTGNWRTQTLSGHRVLRVDVDSEKLKQVLSVYQDKGMMFRKPKSAERSSNVYRVDNGEDIGSANVFSLTQSGLTKQVVADLANRLGFGGVVIVDSDEQLPYYIREDVYSDRMNGYLQGAWKGIYRDGVCYINAPAHVNEHDAVVSILHEAVVHKGLRCLFPSDNELNAFLDKCYNGLMQIKYAADSKIGEGLERYKAIEEAIGDFADNEQYKPMYKKILDWIRTAISKVLRAVGVTKGIPDDVELRDILKQAAVAARERAPYDGNSPGATLYSSSSEVERRFPGWRANMTTAKGGHKTQIAGTVATYGKIGEHLLSEGFNGTILDASSGKGIGTAALREMGFVVDDVEPYAENGYNPRYSSYEDVEQQYDLVISNAVLNVVEDDVRGKLLEQMKGLVAPGGRLFVNVRPASAIETQIKNKVELDSPSEVMVLDNKGKPQSYQKGFTAAELKEYVASKLGDGFTVVQATSGNIGTTGGVAVVATREGKPPINAARFGKVYYRMSLSSRRQSFMDGLADWLNDVKDWKALGARLLGWGENRGGVRPFVNRTMSAAKGELAAGQEEVRVVMKNINDARTALRKETWAGEVDGDLDNLLRDKIQASAVRHGNDPRVQRLVASVMRGRKLLDGLSLRIASEMGDLLPLSTGLAIQNNVGKYTIRAYEKFLNPKYKPSQDVVDNAKAAIETEFLNRFAAVSAHVNNTNYTQGVKRQQMLDYLVTRDDNLLVGKSKQFEKKARIYSTLIDNAMSMCNDAISVVANGGNLGYNVDATLLANTVQGTVDMLLEKDVGEGGYMGDKSSARWKIARQSFLHRKDLPGWLRDLYGEIYDYGGSIALTAYRSVRVLAMNNMYRDLLAYNSSLPMDAKDRIFYDAPYTDNNKKCNVRMDGFGFGVLRGMYTDRNTYKMLNSYSGDESWLPSWLRKWFGIARMSKTVLNVPTHQRNVIGNIYFAAMDAECLRNPKRYLMAWKEAFKVLRSDKDAMLAERQRLMRLGVIGSGAHSEEYARTMKELYGDNSLRALRMESIWDVMKKPVKFLETAYAIEDNLFRVSAFYSKTSRGMSAADAAEEVSNLYTTYDRAPVIADIMRRSYLLAPDFMSFKLETLRTTWNAMKYALQGAKHGDFYRAVGVGLSLAAPTSTLYWVCAMIGHLIRDDDDEKDEGGLSRKEFSALRDLLPEYRECNFIWPWKEGNKIKYVDVEYIYPNEQLSLLLALSASNRPVLKKIGMIRDYAIDNYLLGGMVPKNVAEQWTNSHNGREIANSYDGIFERSFDRFVHSAQLFVPQMATYFGRGARMQFWDKEDRLVTPSGEVITPGGEYKKMVLPLRVYQLDPEEAYVRKMKKLHVEIVSVRGDANAAVRRWQKGEVSRADANKAIKMAREKLSKGSIIDSIHRTNQAGQTLGLGFSSREQLLHEAGFTREDTQRIMSNIPLEYTLPHDK